MFMYFCIMNYIGTKGEVYRQLNIYLNPTVVYATDCSKAVVPVLFLILCSFVVYIMGRLMLLSLLVLFVLVSPFVLSFCHLAWGRGSWSLCFTYICLFVLRVCVFVFLLVSRAGCGL